MAAAAMAAAVRRLRPTALLLLCFPSLTRAEPLLPPPLPPRSPPPPLLPSYCHELNARTDLASVPALSSCSDLSNAATVAQYGMCESFFLASSSTPALGAIFLCALNPNVKGQCTQPASPIYCSNALRAGRKARNAYTMLRARKVVTVSAGAGIIYL